MQHLGFGQQFEHHWGGDGGWLLGPVLGLVVMAVLVTLVVLVVLRATGRTSGRPAPPAPETTPRPDAALAELRLRYARGEVSRDDYLRTAADLSAAAAPPGDTTPAR